MQRSLDSRHSVEYRVRFFFGFGPFLFFRMRISLPPRKRMLTFRQPRNLNDDFSSKIRNSFFELLLGVPSVLFEQLPLDFLGDFEREEFVGMPFDTILEIVERLAAFHFEAIKFLFGLVELSADVLEIFFGTSHGGGIPFRGLFIARKRFT